MGLTINSIGCVRFIGSSKRGMLSDFCLCIKYFQTMTRTTKRTRFQDHYPGPNKWATMVSVNLGYLLTEVLVNANTPTVYIGNCTDCIWHAGINCTEGIGHIGTVRIESDLTSYHLF